MALFLIILYFVIVFKLFMRFINDPTRVKKDCIFTVFAPPGCGKSTLLAYIVYHFTRKGFTVYANFDCVGSIRINWSDIGNYNFRDSVVLIDEAGIDLNNRAYMTLTAKKIKFLKTHRHYRCSMWFASQAHDDIDITVRRLSQVYYVVSRTLLCRFTGKFKLRKIRKGIDIDKFTRQVIDVFEWVPLSTFVFCGRKYWKLFDSFDIGSDKLPDFVPDPPPIPAELFLQEHSEDLSSSAGVDQTSMAAIDQSPRSDAFSLDDFGFGF